jgi:hypothetical protein
MRRPIRFDFPGPTIGARLVPTQALAPLRHPACYRLAMRKTSLPLVLGLFGLCASQCSPSLTALVVPALVQRDQPFTVVVRGTSPPASYHGNAPVGCVVQVPLGVAVLAVANSWNSAMAVDSMVAACTSEPGHYLTSFVGLASLPVDGTLALTLRAGASAPPTGTIKVALGLANGGWVPTSPAGVTDFAQIGGSHAGTFVVTDDPVFAPDTGVPVANGAPAAVGDVDGDGNDDVVTWEAGGQVLAAVLSRPGAAPASVSTAVATGGGGALVLGHFDRDGRCDVAFGGQVWFGDGGGGFGSASALPGAPVMDFVAAGDVDADGVTDLVCGGPGELRVLRSHGERTFSDWSAGIAALPAGYQYSASPWHMGDVTGDGHADLVGLVAPQVGNPARDLLLIAGDGAGAWTTGTPSPVGSATDVQVGDLDGDGVPEVVVGGSHVAPLFQVWNAAANGSWAAGFVAPQLGSQAAAVRLLDHDRDGVLDVLAVQSATPALVRLLRGTGGGAFVEWANHGLPTALPAPARLLVGDWNGDTFPDVASDGLGWLGQATGARPYGAGCAAVGITPTLAGNGMPQQGNLGFGLELTGPPHGAAFVWVGFSKRNGLALPPLPFDLGAFGAPGCSVLAEPRALSFVLADAAGIARLPLGIPVAPSLHQVSLFAQGAVLVPAANAFGALLSAGLVVRID